MKIKRYDIIFLDLNAAFLFFRFQLYNIDVWAVLIFLLVVIATISVVIIWKIVNYCCCRKKPKTKKE